MAAHRKSDRHSDGPREQDYPLTELVLRRRRQVFYAGAISLHSEMHVYEVRPRKDKRGVNLISDALPFGRL
jgi:hypothetical protein